MVVDIEVVGVQWERDTVRDVEGRHGVRVRDPDRRDTVANDMENGSSDQQQQLVGILPLHSPNLGIVVQSRNLGVGVAIDNLDNSLATETGGMSRLGGQGRVGILLTAFLVMTEGAGKTRSILSIRIVTIATGGSGRTGDKLLPVGVKLMQRVVVSLGRRGSSTGGRRSQVHGLKRSGGGHWVRLLMKLLLLQKLSCPLCLGQLQIMTVWGSERIELLLGREISPDKDHNQSKVRAKSLPAEEDGIQGPLKVNAQQDRDAHVQEHVETKGHTVDATSRLQNNQQGNLKQVVKSADYSPNLANIEEQIGDDSDPSSVNVDDDELVDLSRGVLLARLKCHESSQRSRRFANGFVGGKGGSGTEEKGQERERECNFPHLIYRKRRKKEAKKFE